MIDHLPLWEAQQSRKVLFMQKLNFLLAFAVTFFVGCGGGSGAVDAGAPVAAAVETPAAAAVEAAPAAPAAAVEAVVESAAPAAEATMSEAPAAAPAVVESH
jgi:hypothetical protein